MAHDPRRSLGDTKNLAVIDEGGLQGFIDDIEIVDAETRSFDVDDDAFYGLENVYARKPFTEVDAGFGAVDLGEVLEKLVDVFSQTRCVGKSVPFLDHYASRGKDRLDDNTCSYARQRKERDV